MLAMMVKWQWLLTRSLQAPQRQRERINLVMRKGKIHVLLLLRVSVWKSCSPPALPVLLSMITFQVKYMLFPFHGSIMNDNQIFSCMCCKGMAFIGCNLLSNTGAVCPLLSWLRNRVHGWDNQKEQLNPTIVVCLRIFSIFWSNSVTLQ